MTRDHALRAAVGALAALTMTTAFSPGAAQAQEIEACTNKATDLIVGQTIDVGDVNVCNDDTTLTVTYQATFPWCLLKTHLQVATSVDDIPQNRAGIPQPGQFDDGDDYDPCVGLETFEIPMADIGDGVDPDDEVVVAAHARALNTDSGQEDSAWGDGIEFAKRGPWATYFVYEVEEQSCDRPGGFCTVFVTSRTFTGNLIEEALALTGDEPDDGLAAGDAICQHLADEAEFQGIFKAWLAILPDGPSPSEPDRFTHASVRYVLVNDAQIALDWNRLVDGELDNPIAVTEGGDTVQAGDFTRAWTAVRADGSPGSDNPTRDCAGWTTPLEKDEEQGAYGLIEDVGVDWTDAAITLPCEDRSRLYCFAQ